MYICMYVLYIYIYIYVCMYIRGFPGGTSGKELSCQCRRQKRDAGSIPGSGRSLHTLACLLTLSKPTPIFLPGESH